VVHRARTRAFITDFYRFRLAGVFETRDKKAQKNLAVLLSSNQYWSEIVGQAIQNQKCTSRKGSFHPNHTDHLRSKV